LEYIHFYEGCTNVTKTIDRRTDDSI